MVTGLPGEVIQNLRKAMLLRERAGLTDGQLLRDYISHRDEAAFAALVQRHGPMVWGVCRRVLDSHHDAEDAFQATFLVLVRRAASITSPELLANWLYGVAHQTTLKARAIAHKRKGREQQVTEMPESAAVEQDPWNDLRPLLDQELSRLPDRYRAVLVLCDLEGETRKEAARQLGVPEGTVGSRLARARVLLAKRLAQRGVVLSGAALAAVLAQQAVSACVPTSVVVSTIKAASVFAAGTPEGTGAISVKVATLTEGVMKAMLMSKLKAVVAVVLVLGFFVTGATVLTYRTVAAQSATPATPIAEEQPATPQKPAQDSKKEGTTALSKEIADLQGEWLAVAMEWDGEKIPLAELISTKWVVKGNEITAVARKPKDADYKMSFKLDPGKTPKEIDITYLDGPEKGETGKGIYTLEGRRLRMCFAEKGRAGRPKEFATATGSFFTFIDLEKEAFTAWGKEFGGLQAGLGYDAGQKRAYHHGETVKLVVRVRNVGKEAVTFQYLRQFLMEKPPAVTDGAGKPVRLGGVTRFGFHIPVDVNLVPGKEIDLYEWEPQLRPASERDNQKPNFSTLYGTGKFHIQYERVFGNSSAGAIMLDPALSKLATGKLELEIKPAPPPATEKSGRISNEDKRSLTQTTAAKAADGGDKKAKDDKEPPWGEAVGGWRMRLTTPNGTEYRGNTPLALFVELQNVSDEPLSLGLLAACADPEVTADGKRLITRTPIDLSPWEGRRDQLPAGASIKWMVDFDRLRFATQPLKAGTALHVRFRLAMQGETPQGKPDPGNQRLLFSNEVSLKLKDDHPSILSGEAGLPAKWTNSTELVYREHIPLLGYDALRINGKGRAWLVSVGRGMGKPPAAGPIRTEVVLKREDLDRLAKFLRDQKLWELPELSQAKIPAPDEGEIRLSIGAGRGSLVGSVPNSSVRGQPKLQALQAEMAKVMALVREQKAEDEQKEGSKPPDKQEEQPQENLLPRGPYTTGPIGPEIVPQPAWGKPLNGLRLGLYQTDPKGDGKPRLTVVLENVGTEDLVLILGQSWARGKKHRLSMGLNLTTAEGMLKRSYDLRAKGSKRDDLADGAAAGPFVVQLVAGGRYTISSDLHDYYDPKDVDAVLAPGKYRVAARFVGQDYLSGWKGKTDKGPRTWLDIMTYWTGSVESGVIQVTLPAQPAK